ncbi:MAG: DUF1841 family protein [Pseudomonadota bacterium]
MFGSDRGELRAMYAEAWQRRRAGRPLTSLQTQIADVIAEHPEYHEALSPDESARDYAPDGGRTNPFLHMGLHLAVRDQVATDRPQGIRGVFERLAAAEGSAHAAEHRMIDCLAEALWQAQRDGTAPDEAGYLERLRSLPGR